MKKALHVLLALIFVSIGLTSSCSLYKDQKVNLYHGMQPSSKFIKVIKCTPDEVTFCIQIQFTQKKLYHIIEQKKLYHIIEDEEKNFISEGWFPITLGIEVFYILKMKAKEGFFFEPGQEYALCIGLENPEQTIRYSANYRCKIYHKFTMQIQSSTRLRSVAGRASILDASEAGG